MSNILLIIIIITVITSIVAWQRKDIFMKLLFSPYIMIRNKEYYRIITHGFIHGGWGHLIINMLVLWSFGQALIIYFGLVWGQKGSLLFLLLYISALVISSLYSLMKNKDNSSYSAIGASGAVSAVVFACIFFNPWSPVYFFGVLPIPGIVFGGIYLIYSYRMQRKGRDNIGHDAHFFGAVYGFIFPLLLKPSLFEHFIKSLLNF